MDNQNNSPRLNDDYFNVVSLPMDKQHATTIEERKAFFEDLKKKVLGQKKDDIVVDKPLTTDVIGRGYPATQFELDTINKINSYERNLLDQNPSLKPNNNGESRYFIVQDGRIFKTSDFISYYGLDTSTMEWTYDQTYMSIMNDMYLKFSELRNFRDYYPEKELDKELGGFPR